jgi:glycosyltransferase involved in cell wall biosynthesis
MQKTNFAYQIIISDDNSTDGSIEIIKSYTKKHSNIMTIFSNNIDLVDVRGHWAHSKRLGILGNTLRAYAYTKTDYFCCLDSDDYWTDENRLQKAFDFFENNPDYTIYATNIMCVYEDKTKDDYLWFGADAKESDFDCNDLNISMPSIPQTSGAFFRNVIFKNAIPEIMTRAVGTIHEPAFRADPGRYMMHLKFGKAKFINSIESVYRIHGIGMWSRLHLFEQHTANAQMRLDYNAFYEYKYEKLFLNNCFKIALMAIEQIENYILNRNLDDFYLTMFLNVINRLNENRDCIVFEAHSRKMVVNTADKLSLKNSIRFKVWKYLNNILSSKGII